MLVIYLNNWNEIIFTGGNSITIILGLQSRLSSGKHDNTIDTQFFLAWVYTDQLAATQQVGILSEHALRNKRVACAE